MRAAFLTCTLVQPSLTLLRAGQYTAASNCQGSDTMLLSRDYVGYMASELVKRLVVSKMIETPSADTLTKKVRAAMQDEISVGNRLKKKFPNFLPNSAAM